MLKIDYKKLKSDLDNLVKLVPKDKYKSIYAIPRGGVPIGMYLASKLNLELVDKIEQATLVVDDLIDSGNTTKDIKNDIAVLYIKSHSPEPTYYVDKIDGWIELPYENTTKDEEDIVIRLLEVLGENPNREGLKETPKRVLKFYRQFLNPPEYNFTVFDSEGYDEMIVQDNIPFYSLCEHHLAPFFGTATVAYIPNGKIVGLSKLARTVEWYAGNLQNQERITHQIANRLQEELNPLGVAVTLKAKHLCMEMRGVKTHDVYTTTTKLLGFFKDKPDTRDEYLRSMK